MVQKLTSRMWEPPFIPAAPAYLPGTEQAEIRLNESSGDGTWRFLYDIPDYHLPGGIPAPSAEKQDFDFSVWENRAWKPIKVPGEPLMQGFDIQTNQEYYYQRRVEVPEQFFGNRILLRFDGVYSNARVWIDGKYIRTHVGGFTTWDADITEYVIPGKAVTLTVGVADIYSAGKGIWNPDEKPVNNPADASKYAHHNIGGILRDVSLVAMPYDHIARTYVETEFDEEFCDAVLKIAVQLSLISENALLRIELLDFEKVVTEAEIPVSDPREMTEPKQISIPVSAPKKWDAEHPYLYTLRLTLSVGEQERQVNEQRIGFREIWFGGKNGSDTNKIYVNGREIKLRGTCRHDVSADLGRYMTRDEYYEEIRAYKRANINYIRTSHYPASEHLLDACDELGIYVEEEAAVCFQGPHGDVFSRYEDFPLQFMEMIERDRNRACILIWSLGNESYYNKVANQSGGNAFQDERDYLRDTDNSRPCIFSWLDTGEPERFVDIRSEHYAEISGAMGGSSQPVLHEEYVHVSCYNLDELQRDVNVRNFWGESIRRAWEKIFVSDGALGGALWSGIDDVFYIPRGTKERWQSHSGGRAAGYGEWGSVLDAYLREKPEAYLTKKAYSPVRIQEKLCTFAGDELKIPVKNWFDHTNMNELLLKYMSNGITKEKCIAENIGPHGEGVLTVKGIPEDVQEVNLKFYTSDGIMVDEYNVKRKEAQWSFEPAGEVPPVIEETDDEIIVQGAEFELTFSKVTGMLSSGIFGKERKCILTGGPYLHVTGMITGKWIPEEAEGISARTDGQYAVVELRGCYENGQGVWFRMKISGNGMIASEYEITTAPEKTAGLSEVGISFDLADGLESVSWKRNGVYSAYPEEHIGRNEGTAYKVRTGSGKSPERYGVKPNWSWKDDMKNYFVYPEGDSDNGIVTNDFKAMRENVYWYGVNYGEEQIKVECPEANIAVRVGVSCDKDYIDDRDPVIQYTGDWKKVGDETDHLGTLSYSTAAGDTCEFTFVGTGVRYIGAKKENTGKVKIYIDGEFTEEIDTFSNLGKDLKQAVIYSIDGMEKKEHTLKLVAQGGAGIAVDAFEILQQNEHGNERAKLVIDNQWYYPNLSWGNYLGKEGRMRIGLKGLAVLRLTYRK